VLALTAAGSLLTVDEVAASTIEGVVAAGVWV
jgi:hypothetical protein